MKAPGDQHDSAGAYGSPKTSSASITGRFFARLWDLDCVLELQLDGAGRFEGSFIADGESLEITSGPPDPQRAVCGAIRAHDLAESFAGFKARLDEDGLFLEVDAIADEMEPESVTRTIFLRIG